MQSSQTAETSSETTKQRPELYSPLTPAGQAILDAYQGQWPGDLLTADEVAAIARLSKMTLSGWRHRGRGPAWVKLAGRVRYPLGEFVRWIDSQVLRRRSV